MQIERLFKIVYYLFDKETATAQELADYLSVSKRTVFPDIDALSLSGIPVYAERGNKGGEMYGFILSFGEYAEVLEPEHIRKNVFEKGLAIVNHKYMVV